LPPRKGRRGTVASDPPPGTDDGLPSPGTGATSRTGASGAEGTERHDAEAVGRARRGEVCREGGREPAPGEGCSRSWLPPSRPTSAPSSCGWRTIHFFASRSTPTATTSETRSPLRRHSHTFSGTMPIVVGATSTNRLRPWSGRTSLHRLRMGVRPGCGRARGDLAWSQALGTASHGVMYAIAGDAGSAVLDSHFWRGVAEADLRAVGRPLFQICCRCPLEVAIERYRQRATSSARHPGHLPEHQADDVIASRSSIQSEQYPASAARPRRAADRRRHHPPRQRHGIGIEGQRIAMTVGTRGRGQARCPAPKEAAPAAPTEPVPGSAVGRRCSGSSTVRAAWCLAALRGGAHVCTQGGPQPVVSGAQQPVVVHRQPGRAAAVLAHPVRREGPHRMAVRTDDRPAHRAVVEPLRLGVWLHDRNVGQNPRGAQGPRSRKSAGANAKGARLGTPALPPRVVVRLKIMRASGGHGRA